MSAFLAFPEKTKLHSARMARIDLEARYRWMRLHADDWVSEQTDGYAPEPRATPTQRRLMELMDKKWGKIKGPTEAEMRERIAEGRKTIERRNALKAWLRAQGASDVDLDTSEHALQFIFDKLG
jgi:hypothetical protein